MLPTLIGLPPRLACQGVTVGLLYLTQPGAQFLDRRQVRRACQYGGVGTPCRSTPGPGWRCGGGVPSPGSIPSWTTVRSGL